jgi:hypothetical protein
MTNQEKKQILDNNFSKNYNDYYTITQKIRNNKKKHQNIEVDDILTIIYLNINKRLDKIDEKYFNDNNQFRALFINTVQSQIMWGNSDITQHTTKLSLGHSNVVFEDAEEEIDITTTPLRINGERIIQINEEEDDYDAKFSFIQEQYPQLLTNNVDKAMWRLIVQQNNITNKSISDITNIPLTTTAKLFQSFKATINYVYQNHQYIRFKPSLTLLAAMHPEFARNLLKLINIIENKHPDIYVVITEGYTAIKEQYRINKVSGGGITSLNYGLGARIAIFDNEGELELNDVISSNLNKLGLEMINGIIQIKDFNLKKIKKKFTAKNFIKNSNFVKLC